MTTKDHDIIPSCSVQNAIPRYFKYTIHRSKFIKMNWLQLRYFSCVRIGSFMVLLILATQLFGQQIQLKPSLIDSILNEGKNKKDERLQRTAYNLRNIYKFNKVKKRLNHTDTIRVYHTNNSYTAKYKNKLLPLINRTIEVEGLIRIYERLGHSPTLITSITSIGKNHQQVLTINYSEKYGEYVIEKANLQNGLEYGEYKKEAWSGFVIERGSYMQTDGIHSDTIFFYDPITYEEIIEITEHPRTPIKCGVWTSRNEEGDLVYTNEQSCEKFRRN